MTSLEMQTYPVHLRTGGMWVYVGEAEVILEEGQVKKIISFTPIVPFVKPPTMPIDDNP